MEKNFEEMEKLYIQYQGGEHILTNKEYEELYNIQKKIRLSLMFLIFLLGILISMVIIILIKI